MNVEVLKRERLTDFVEFCKKHRRVIDDSFLYDEDLKDFEPNSDNPTYIISNDQGDIIAAASLNMDDYNRRGKKARFRIFHSVVQDIECYRMLMVSLLSHTAGLDKVFLFIQKDNDTLIKIMDQLDFDVERYSFFLLREDLGVPVLHLPEDFAIRPFRPGIDEGIWCEVRNAGFAKLQGNETPATPTMVKAMISKESYLEGGMMILFHQDKPVGVVRGEADEYEDAPVMNIGPLAILPEYQGRGLGRILLRAALEFAKEKSYKRTVLSVNGENERALALYIQEGFKEEEAVICYKYDLKN